ncbi:MAG: response regulator [archaeon]|nr:response regulator [archaeon]
MDNDDIDKDLEQKLQNKKRILIVEDEAIVAFNLKLDLESLGYEVVGTTSSGDEAINIAVEHRPDLTIMDINLKGKISGIEAAKRILALDLAVIYLTANADNTTFNKALELSPASSFIEKPYSLSNLSTNIELAINRQAVESEKVNEARGISQDAVSEEIEYTDDSKSLIETEEENYQNYIGYNELQSKAKTEYLLSREVREKFLTNKYDENYVYKILVVEDEAITALNLKMDLESLGYEVIGTVDNGADAISIALEKFPDFVMMNIRLKGDVSGIEASEEINK